MKLKIVIPRSNFGRLLQWALFGVGIACLGYCCYSYGYSFAHQAYEGWRFDHDIKHDSVTADRHVTPVAFPKVLPNPDKSPARSPSEGTDVIGRIAIRRLHLSAIVEEGVDHATLARAVGHIPGTAFPGEPGNVGVAGHRDTFFRALKDLRVDDQIDFTTLSGHFHYLVASLTIVDPTDVGVLAPTRDRELTIVTCYPFHYIGNAPQRYIVRAVEIRAARAR